MVALGRIVFTSREHVIALEPRGKGLLGVTLRYPYEVRKEDEYFDDIADEKIPKDMLELASHIVETKAGHFEPKKFEDQYEDALKELIRKKQSGQPIESAASQRRSLISWMHSAEALRQAVSQRNDKPQPLRRAALNPNVPRRKNRARFWKGRLRSAAVLVAPLGVAAPMAVRHPGQRWPF